jgi:hypothetical protein
MPAPKGNKFAIGNSGREKMFKTVQELQDAIDEYFKGNKNLTISGLARHLKINRCTIYNYSKNVKYKTYFDVMNNAINKINPTSNKPILDYSNCLTTSQRIAKKIREIPKCKIRNSLSTLIRIRLKSRNISDTKIKNLPYTISELMTHLEHKFDDKMNWQNYGNYWHIDHIKPDSLFNYSSVKDEEFLKCWNLSNLQPLSRVDNFKKGNRYYE